MPDSKSQSCGSTGLVCGNIELACRIPEHAWQWATSSCDRLLDVSMFSALSAWIVRFSANPKSWAAVRALNGESVYRDLKRCRPCRKARLQFKDSPPLPTAGTARRHDVMDNADATVEPGSQSPHAVPVRPFLAQVRSWLKLLVCSLAIANPCIYYRACATQHAEIVVSNLGQSQMHPVSQVCQSRMLSRCWKNMPMMAIIAKRPLAIS